MSGVIKPTFCSIGKTPFSSQNQHSEAEIKTFTSYVSAVERYQTLEAVPLLGAMSTIIDFCMKYFFLQGVNYDSPWRSSPYYGYL